MPRRLHKLLLLTASERSTLLAALVLLPLTALAVRLLGFRRWQAALGRGAIRPLSPQYSGDQGGETMRLAARARRSAWLVDVAARRGPWPANCLQRSMTLWYLLRRHGVASELCIGARKAGERFDAHAWVEWGGEVLNDAADVALTYAPFARAGALEHA